MVALSYPNADPSKSSPGASPENWIAVRVEKTNAQSCAVGMVLAKLGASADDGGN